MNNNKLIGALAVLVIVVCVGRFVYKQFGGRTKVDVQPFATLGSLVAEETSKLLPAKGTVVVITVDTAKYHIPTLDTLLEAFTKGVKKKRDITVSSVEHLRIPPTTFMALSSGSLVPPAGQFAPGQFQKIVQNNSSADAIVSFVGLPSSLGNGGELQQKHPKIVVVSYRDPDLENLLRSHVIDLAIVPRVEPSSGKDSKNSLYEILSSDK